MTNNSINYAKYLEDVRAHRAEESVARRQATVAELNAQTNARNADTNASMAEAQWASVGVQAAYNRAMEAIRKAELLEAQRHNTEMEFLNKYGVDVNDLINQRNNQTQMDVARLRSDTDVLIADKANTTHMLTSGMSLIGSVYGSTVNAASRLASSVVRGGADVGSAVINAVGGIISSNGSRTRALPTIKAISGIAGLLTGG